MPEIERDKVRAMLAELPEDQHEALLLRLKERGFTVRDAIAQHPQPGPDNAMAPWEALKSAVDTRIPGLSKVADFARDTAPGYIAEKGGELGFPKTGAAVGTAVGTAGELGTIGTVGEAGAMAVGGALGKGLGMAGKALLPPIEKRAPNIVKAVKAALTADILPSPAQILQSAPLAQFEEVASRIPFFGGRIKAMREAQEQAYQAVRTSAVEKAGPKLPASELGARTQEAVTGALDATAAQREKELIKLHGAILKKAGPSVEREQVGRMLDEIRVARTEAARKEAGKLYDEVSAAIPPEADHVTDNNIRLVADKIAKRYENVPRASLDPKAAKLLEDLKSGPGNKVIENAVDPVVIYSPTGQTMELGGDDAIVNRKAYTFNEMQTMRETLNGLIQQERMKVPGGQMTVEGRIYKDLKSALDSDIQSFANGLPGDLKRKFDVATAYYRDNYKAIFGNDTMKSMAQVAKENPEDVYRMLIKPGDVSDIRRVKAAVGEPGMAPLRRRVIEEMVTGPAGEVLGGPEIMKNLSRQGISSLKEILTPDQLKQVVKYAETRELPKFVESEIERKLRGLIFQSKGLYRAPEDVVKRVLDGDVVTFRAVKKIVGPDGADYYRRRVIEDIIGEAQMMDALPGQMRNKTSLGIAKALKSYDENFLKEVFDKQALAEIEQIDTLRALLESQPRLAANAPNTAAALIAPAATGSLATLAFFNMGKAAAVTIGADVLSRLYTSKAGRQLLIRGLDPKYVKHAPTATAIAARIADAVVQNAKENQANRGATP